VPIPGILVALLGVVTVLSLIARNRAPFEMLEHFRPHLIVAGLAGAALCLALSFLWEWALVSFGLALVNYAALPARAWLRPEPQLEKNPGLTVVWANVWEKDTALERTLDWAKAQDADLILLTEFPKMDAAAVLPGDYAHRLDSGSDFKKYEIRVVALSRMPIEGGEVRAGPGPHIRPWLTFSVSVDGQRLNLAATHPVPPYTPKMLAERAAQIALLSPAEPFVIAGDFNATPWTPGYAAIPGKRVGAYLFKPTWFNSLPLLGLPIDHIMVSPGLKASVYRVSPGLGSDHRAILARVHLPCRAGGP